MQRLAGLSTACGHLCAASRQPHDHGRTGDEPHPALAASCALTCAADGLTRAVPSGNSTVGTVWLPPLTDITNSAAAGSRSMSTSAISMPDLASWFLRFRQKPHQDVVYIVS